MDARGDDWHRVRVRHASTVGDLDGKMHTYGTSPSFIVSSHILIKTATLLDNSNRCRHHNRPHPHHPLNTHDLDHTPLLPPKDPSHTHLFPPLPVSPPSIPHPSSPLHPLTSPKPHRRIQHPPCIPPIRSLPHRSNLHLNPLLHHHANPFLPLHHPLLYTRAQTPLHPPCTTSAPQTQTLVRHHRRRHTLRVPRLVRTRLQDKDYSRTFTHYSKVYVNAHVAGCESTLAGR
jgi:hypothetical protein